jgi:hypothetical protein
MEPTTRHHIIGLAAGAPEKKAGEAEVPQVLGLTGLLCDGPPEIPGLSFVKSSDKSKSLCGG